MPFTYRLHPSGVTVAKRPPLSDSSFLAAVFSPSRNPVPVGLRKRKVTGVTGRKATRVKSFNQMSALNQRILDETKQREAYLRGDITISEAKRALRSKAVDLGIVKPARRKSAGAKAQKLGIGDKRSRALDHLWRKLQGTTTRKPVNFMVLRRGTLLMSPEQIDRALQMEVEDIKTAANNPDEQIDISEAQKLNPFWYH